MTLIIDSSFLVALYDVGEVRHQRAYEFAESNTERMLVPDLVLPEVSFLLRRNLGHAYSLNFFDFFENRSVSLLPVFIDDLTRVYEISQQYADARLDLVDCCIMAIAERMNVTRIATFDRRDFGIFQPRHCDFLELLP